MVAVDVPHKSIVVRTINLDRRIGRTRPVRRRRLDREGHAFVVPAFRRDCCLQFGALQRAHLVDVGGEEVAVGTGIGRAVEAIDDRRTRGICVGPPRLERPSRCTLERVRVDRQRFRFVVIGGDEVTIERRVVELLHRHQLRSGLCAHVHRLRLADCEARRVERRYQREHQAFAGGNIGIGDRHPHRLRAHVLDGLGRVVRKEQDRLRREAAAGQLECDGSLAGRVGRRGHFRHAQRFGDCIEVSVELGDAIDSHRHLWRKPADRSAPSGEHDAGRRYRSCGK